MTEDEAKQKWCPVLSFKTDRVQCIGPSCALWKWEQTPAEAKRKKRILEEQGDYKSKPPEIAYCGLGGKP